MADGVQITAGSGTTIATDDAGAGGHVQVVKLAIAADGSATALPGDATDGLLVNLGSNNDVTGTVTANLAAGTNNVGDVDIVTWPDITQNGSIAATGSNTFTVGDGVSAVALRVSGTWVGTLDFEGSVDATTWDPIYGVRAGVGIVYTQITEALVDNIFRFTTAGFNQVRARFTRTSGTVTVAWRGSHGVSGVYVNFPLPPGDNNIGNVDVVTLPALAAGTNYVGKVRLTDGSNDAVVSSAGGLAVGGPTAHDAADAGNPVKLGARAVAGLNGITLVAAADRTDLLAGIDGALIVREHCGLEDIVSGTASNTDGASFAVIAAGAAGIKHYLTQVTIVNTSTSFTYVEIKDGTTTKVVLPAPAQSGAAVSFNPPIAGTAATAWNADPGAATTTIYCSAVGFKSKV